MRFDSDSSRPKARASLSDEDLYRALQSGQAAALGQIYDRHSAIVYGLALRILTQPQEAQELTQEIFLALWQKQTYQPSRGALSSFLLTMTRSRAIDKLRSRSTKVRFLARWSQIMVDESTGLTPLETLEIDQRSQQVRSALSHLPEKQRLVLELAYYEGLSQSEIATRLGNPLGTVKSWSRQGLLGLRKLLIAEV